MSWICGECLGCVMGVLDIWWVSWNVMDVLNMLLVSRICDGCPDYVVGFLECDGCLGYVVGV